MGGFTVFLCETRYGQLSLRKGLEKMRGCDSVQQALFNRRERQYESLVA